MQTKRQSLIETILNVFSGMVIGFSISQLAHMLAPYIQQYVWGGFVWELSAGSNIVMTVILTVVSVIRSYFWRRHFNKKHFVNYTRHHEVEEATKVVSHTYKDVLDKLKDR